VAAVPPAGIGAAALAAWLSDCPWSETVATDRKEVALVLTGDGVPYCATAGAVARKLIAPNVSRVGINAVFTKLSSLPNQPYAIAYAKGGQWLHERTTEKSANAAPQNRNNR
jgi:hypothetical protein